MAHLALIINEKKSLPIAISFNGKAKPNLSTSRGLILKLNMKIESDVIPGLNELKDMKIVKNLFQMPNVISYKDYINTGYDNVMEKHREARRQ
jgi:hypothetical protein